jgi:transposase InsO family protein
MAESKQKHPKRGRRYSASEKAAILKYAEACDVAGAVEKFQVSDVTIYEWRRAAQRRGEIPGRTSGVGGDASPAAPVEAKGERDRKIIAKWRRHPGYGPSQVRNMLRKDGFTVSVGTCRHVMEANGYLPPKLKRKEHQGRYEAGRPRELYHLDFFHFHVHKQKQCVLFIEDDFSRFIAGWALSPEEKADAVIECFEQSIERYGKPEGAMSDRGSAFHSWRGLSRFEAFLESYEINYYLAREAAVNGKVEALNASFQKECLRQQEFMDLTDAARAIGNWVFHYNHSRTHHGLGGLLVPADRFYGLVEHTLRRMEQGQGAHSLDMLSPDNRGLELLRVVSYGGKPQVWLMGEKLLG